MFQRSPIVFVLFYAAIFSCSVSKNELPVFDGASECSREELPVFVQPVSDIRDGNGLEAAYCSSRDVDRERRIELSLVFQDERHPSSWKDFLYRIYRKFRYGRNKDVETLRLQISSSGNLSKVHLKNVYSGTQKFASDPVEHYDAVLGPERLKSEGKRPVLYVNTWNHMFGETDHNPELEKQTLSEYELRYGTRDDLDGFYSGK
ncbi:hypothetical protein CH379_006065 [Leptospira ellisii]|uniref:Lipoprotein n=1 Tax=Leptospira ellisii TaxID=2023197 RepID=A0AAE4TYR3_9LEPT|nr:hypothetical protein [Leptospira ellisii]MDV6235191.1 hypothetical protein [Leptospira ellisii]